MVVSLSPYFIRVRRLLGHLLKKAVQQNEYLAPDKKCVLAASLIQFNRIHIQRPLQFVMAGIAF
jgi:hypothetical protein